MIECLGVLIYNREDLLARLVASIDHPVGQLVIVNNGALSSLDAQVKQWVESNGKIDSWIVYEPGQNVGVAGGWNVLLHHAFLGSANIGCIPSKNAGLRLPQSILILGNDIEMSPGDLAIFEKTLNDFPEADFIFGNHSYSNFMVKRSGYEKCGTFDENMYPGYLEDSTHWQTIRMTGAKAIHAAGLNSKHGGSATINSDPKIAAIARAGHAKNWQYYSRRYGCPMWSHAQERFKHPFDNPNWPPTKWVLSEDRKHGPHYLEGNP